MIYICTSYCTVQNRAEDRIFTTAMGINAVITTYTQWDGVSLIWQTGPFVCFKFYFRHKNINIMFIYYSCNFMFRDKTDIY